MGQVLATLVITLNPSLIVVGGRGEIGDSLLAEIRTAVHRRSVPLATSRSC